MSKITKATFKSFLKKNAGNLFVRSLSRFDGMTDCVQSCKGEFVKMEKTDHFHVNNMGFNGIWLVGESRDYFSIYKENGFTGFEVYNCCGSFVVAVKD